MGKCMVCEEDCFLKASNATRPIQRDDASIVPYKLLEALQKFRAIPHNSKCRYGERGAAAAGAVLKPQGGNCAVLPKVTYVNEMTTLSVSVVIFFE